MAWLGTARGYIALLARTAWPVRASFLA
jgi:hypothetical protein